MPQDGDYSRCENYVKQPFPDILIHLIADPRYNSWVVVAKAIVAWQPSIVKRVIVARQCTGAVYGDSSRC